MVKRYLWGHFLDLAGAGDDTSRVAWKDHLVGRAAVAFDAGCTVGRFVFDMANRSEWFV